MVCGVLFFLNCTPQQRFFLKTGILSLPNAINVNIVMRERDGKLDATVKISVPHDCLLIHPLVSRSHIWMDIARYHIKINPKANGNILENYLKIPCYEDSELILN